ncbi:MAG: hypothetical protein ACLRVT_06730 [Oscillospiraceae bacterium]
MSPWNCLLMPLLTACSNMAGLCGDKVEFVRSDDFSGCLADGWAAA